MVQSLKDEIKAGIDQMRVQLVSLIADAVAKIQVEADKRTEAVIQRLEQAFSATPMEGTQRVSPPTATQQQR
jgi:hypothetical protein